MYLIFLFYCIYNMETIQKDVHIYYYYNLLMNSFILPDDIFRERHKSDKLAWTQIPCFDESFLFRQREKKVLMRQR